MYFMMNLFNSASNFSEYFGGYCERLCQITNQINKGLLTQIVEKIERRIETGNMIFLAEMGGVQQCYLIGLMI
jgi:hypothetical protein